jgi:isoleucyl-tRNA synthetase
VNAGLVRDVIRVIQETRKEIGLEVSDRITLRWSATGELAAALRADADTVAEEVLAVSFTEAEPTAEWRRDEELALDFWINRADGGAPPGSEESRVDA